MCLQSALRNSECNQMAATLPNQNLKSEIEQWRSFRINLQIICMISWTKQQQGRLFGCYLWFKICSEEYISGLDISVDDPPWAFFVQVMEPPGGAQRQGVPQLPSHHRRTLICSAGMAKNHFHARQNDTMWYVIDLLRLTKYIVDLAIETRQTHHGDWRRRSHATRTRKPNGGPGRCSSREERRRWGGRRGRRCRALSKSPSLVARRLKLFWASSRRSPVRPPSFPGTPPRALLCPPNSLQNSQD